MPATRTVDEVTPSGALLLWSELPIKRGKPYKVRVVYPCCGYSAERIMSIVARIRNLDRSAMCKSCAKKHYWENELVSPPEDRPICPICNKRQRKRVYKYGSRHGFKKMCAVCAGDENGPGAHRLRRKRLIPKDMTCPRCGFIAIHERQLQIDHINGDRRNNREDNLEVMCANCHTLKTALRRDNLPRSKRLYHE